MKQKRSNSGRQLSSIIHHLDKLPQIAFDKKSKQMAIAFENKIDLLIPFPNNQK